MEPKDWIRTRHDRWLTKLTKLERELNASPEAAGSIDFQTQIVQAATVVAELEHLADALSVELGERLRG